MKDRPERRVHLASLIEGLGLPPDHSGTELGSVTLTSVPSWIRNPGIFSPILGPREKGAIGSASLALVTSFVVPGGDSDAEKGESEAIQKRAVRSTEDAALSLWLAAAATFNPSFCVVAEELQPGELRWRGAWETNLKLWSHFAKAELSTEDLDLARALAEALGRLVTKGPLFQGAVFAFGSATNDRPDISHLLNWTVLEGLFTPSGDQMTRRLTERLRLFVSDHPAIGVPMSRSRARKLYQVRSDIVHGRIPQRENERRDFERRAFEAFVAVETLVRGCFQTILLDAELRTAFEDIARREKWLKARYETDRQPIARLLAWLRQRLSRNR